MTRKRKARNPRADYPAGWIDTTQVAQLLGIQYQRARDLMLQGRCGNVRELGRTRLVQRSAVEVLKQGVNT